jgi:energy-coupling factor transporter transmembrane protein EcfT
MNVLDPRATVAVLVALTAVVLFGGTAAALVVAVAATLLTVRGRRSGRALRALTLTLPLALAIAILDALAGEPLRGMLAAVRLEVLVLVFAAFAASIDGDRLGDGLLALRVPFAITFVLVTGARFVPITVADVADLRDTARLRGLAFDGPPWRQLASWRVLLVPLVVTTVRRGLQLGEAMELRGLGLPGRSGPLVPLGWTWRDTGACLAAGGTLAALALGLSGCGPFGVTGPSG